MKLTLKQKREIVRRFWAGESIGQIAIRIYEGWITHEQHDSIEQVIRDYMNGKFSLEPKARKR